MRRIIGSFLIFIFIVMKTVHADTPIITPLSNGEISQEQAIVIVCQFLSELFSIPEQQIENDYEFISIHGDIRTMVPNAESIVQNMGSGYSCWQIYTETTLDKRKPFAGFEFFVDDSFGRIMSFKVSVRPNEDCQYAVFYSCTDPNGIITTPCHDAIQAGMQWLDDNRPTGFPEGNVDLLEVAYYSPCIFHEDCSSKIWYLYFSDQEAYYLSSARCYLLIDDATNEIHAYGYSWEDNGRELYGDGTFFGW